MPSHLFGDSGFANRNPDNALVYGASVDPDVAMHRALKRFDSQSLFVGFHELLQLLPDGVRRSEPRQPMLRDGVSKAIAVCNRVHLHAVVPTLDLGQVRLCSMAQRPVISPNRR
jgi:hypothetical protein